MTFTVTRAVRGADSNASEPRDRLQRVLQSTSPSPAGMDLPYAEEVLRLDLRDFAVTVPSALESPSTVE